MTTRAKIATKTVRRASYGRAAVDTDGVAKRDVKAPLIDRKRKSNVEIAPSSRRILNRGTLLK